jgi:ABC-type transport system substrate-binding protein
VNRVILAILGIMAALVLAIGVVAIVMVASGGDDDSTASNGADTPQEEDGDGSAEGEFRLLGAEPITFDPHVAQDADSAVYIVEIFGGLLTLDTQLQLQPDLATEIPTVENGGKVVNPDGTVTYTFRIREGAMFHDRKPVTAETVKFSLERAADPATQSLVAEFFLGDIVGVEAKLNGEATEVSGIQVVDPAAIAITVERDLQSFLYKLTYPTAFIVDPDQVENDDNWTRHPNGTGPFSLEEWRFGEHIILEANPRYHLGAPKVQQVRFLLSGGGLTLYEQDEVDVSGVPLDDLIRVQDPADDLNADYRTGDRLAIDYLGFNTNAPPFDDENVRKAFAMAIDLNQIASGVLNDAAPVANGILIPGLPAYDPAVQGPQFDPEAARQLLEESSYGGPDGLPDVTLAESGTGATAGPTTSVLLEMWNDNLGVDVQVEQAEAATFFQDVSAGRFQMFTLGWIMDYPSEDNLLNLHFDSESPNNDTFYSNPEVDGLLRDALMEPDRQRQTELYRQAEALILEDVPWFPLFYGRYHTLVKPHVQGYELPGAVVPRLRYIELTEEQ